MLETSRLEAHNSKLRMLKLSPSALQSLTGGYFCDSTTKAEPDAMQSEGTLNIPQMLECGSSVTYPAGTLVTAMVAGGGRMFDGLHHSLEVLHKML